MAGSEEGSAAKLADFVWDRAVVVLTGAGCSTESGVPDYRGPEGRLRVRRPIMLQEFLRDPSARVRYWARSAVGWPRFREARPNEGHAALARLEAAGRVRGLITQNVDGLHGAAGSRRVLELHGALAWVRCLDCGVRESRDAVQDRIREANPGVGTSGGRLAPDGDAEIPEHVLVSFRPPICLHCGGDLKPDVVFFGENVPRDRLARAWDVFEEGEALLVVGSSLTVFSGRRFVLRAVERGMPVAILNLGPTRCDEVARLRVEGRAGAVLSEVARSLEGRVPSAAGGP